MYAHSGFENSILLFECSSLSGDYYPIIIKRIPLHINENKSVNYSDVFASSQRLG